MTANHQVAEASVQNLPEAVEPVASAGYKQTEVGGIPEDWEVAPLDSFTSFISYGFTNPMPTTLSGPFMITARDIAGGVIRFSDARCTSQVAFEKLLTSKSKPKKNDLLLTKDGTLGRLAIVGEETICINQSVAILRPNQKIEPSFFKLLLESPFYQEKMLDGAGGSTIKHIYITIVNRMLLGLPRKVEEQTAIANVLSDVDALINELEKLIAKKQAIKTATMQQLLTGRTRLPQFALREDGTLKGYMQSELGEIPEDWDVKALSDIANVKGGKRLPKGKSLVKTPTNHPYIRVADMFIGGVDISDLCYVPNEVAPLIKNYRIFEGELFISVAGTLGVVGQISKDLDGANLTENADRICDISADSSFILYSLSSKRIQDEIAAQSTVGAQPKLALVRIESFLIPLSKYKAEQTAIATILSDMDTEIQALQQRLNKTRQIKQGMMQELLTGKTRLVKPALKENANV